LTCGSLLDISGYVTVPGEDQESSEAESVPQAMSQTKTSDRAFSKIRRELKEEEAAAASPALQLMLLDRIEEFRAELADVKPFRDKFETAERARQVLQEKLKTRIASDVIFGISLSAGSLLIGQVKALWETPPYGVMALGIGVVLILGGIATRIITLLKL
jgi:hypothetical protein